MQTESKKKITNVENCEKTPTIKQFVYYFYTITKWQKKKNKNKNKEVLIAPPLGDVIIHETGTRLTKGGGEGAMGTTARTRQRSTGQGSVGGERPN